LLVPSSLFEQFADILIDPADGGPIRVQNDYFERSGSGRRFDVIDGIPNFFVPTSLSSRAAKTPLRAFASSTCPKQMPVDSLVFEAGCGTGQLSNFLGNVVEAKSVCRGYLPQLVAASQDFRGP
jgi:hypothetical protein